MRWLDGNLARAFDPTYPGGRGNNYIVWQNKLVVVGSSASSPAPRAWTWDGSSWSTLGGDWDGGGPDWCTVWDGSLILCGGRWKDADPDEDEPAIQTTMRWTGSAFENVGEEPWPLITPFAHNGNLYGVAGLNFPYFNGTDWNFLVEPESGTSYAAALSHQGDIYALRSTDVGGGTWNNELVRWTGSSFQAVAPALPTESRMFASNSTDPLAVWDDRLIVCGQFLEDDTGQTLNGIAAWRGENEWEPFVWQYDGSERVGLLRPGMGDVMRRTAGWGSSLATFTSFNSFAEPNFRRWNGSTFSAEVSTTQSACTYMGMFPPELVIHLEDA